MLRNNLNYDCSDRIESLEPHRSSSLENLCQCFDLSQYRCMAYFTVIFERKKYMYWDSYSKKFRYTCTLKCRGKSFPFSTHVKMFYEVSKAPWRLCLWPSLDSLAWFIKFLLKHTTFYKIRSDWTNFLYLLLLLITFASSLVPSQHRQNAGPDLDSTGHDLDPKRSTPWLWCFSWKKKNGKG